MRSLQTKIFFDLNEKYHLSESKCETSVRIQDGLVKFILKAKNFRRKKFQEKCLGLFQARATLSENRARENPVINQEIFSSNF